MSEVNPIDQKDADLARRLSDERPLPLAGFRGALARHLVAHDPGYGPRPANLRLLVAAYLIAGLVVLAIGALIAAGGL